MKNILLVSASAAENSNSRQLGLQLADQLMTNGNGRVTHRNLNESELPLINSAWVEANFTPHALRTSQQLADLSLGHRYVSELQENDIIIVATPIYNFGIPAALKAYFDQILLAGTMFEYSENGPIGLLENKEAYTVISSGGVPLNSPADFATPHLMQMLNFIGLPVVKTVDITGLNQTTEEKILTEAKAAISEIFV